MQEIFQTFKELSEQYTDWKFIFPVHMNPIIGQVASSILGGRSNIMLTGPLDIDEFHNLLQRSYCILTDSGGIQEEATMLRKPVLIMRDTTERPEGLKAGTLKLVGTRKKDILDACQILMEDEKEYQRMSVPSTVYGNGSASRLITEVLLREQFHG